jgi:hypothetical protein
LSYFCYFQGKRKQLPNRRKFGHSGHPGANPTTSIYNASGVKIYNTANSLVRFKTKEMFSCLKNALAYYSAGVVGVDLKTVGLADGSS